MNIPEPSLSPPEPVIVCSCAVCGEDIAAGDRAIRIARDFLLCRKECLIVHVQENYSAEEIAQMIGARKLEVELA